MASKYTVNANGKVIHKSTGLPPTPEEVAQGDRAHDAMMRADEAYQTALVRKYGRNAGDMRYQRDKQTPEIRALSDAYQHAVIDWRATFEETNTEVSK